MLSHLEEFPALSVTAKSYLVCSVLYALSQVLKRQAEKNSVTDHSLPIQNGSSRPCSRLGVELVVLHHLEVPPGTAGQRILLLYLRFLG